MIPQNWLGLSRSFDCEGDGGVADGVVGRLSKELLLAMMGGLRSCNMALRNKITNPVQDSPTFSCLPDLASLVLRNVKHGMLMYLFQATHIQLHASPRRSIDAIRSLVQPTSWA